ncbi:iron-containing alcohol dehydrogenase, partial [Candidatus Poribacteria bacterium]|nr:iron-containing alcohol dehydrogenase [Candidatus Poribacteria bacterium]
GLPLIAVPTTSGTGSEVTPWATFWNKSIKKKYSLSHKLMFSNHAVVDPELTLTLPLSVTASTAFDAVAHALEAFWSKFSNPISDIYALEALGLVANNLKALMDNPDNIELRSCMSSAALYAGLAFSNTKTTAVHSVSYPMTLYYNIPHGAACALLLGEFLVFNKSHITSVKLSRLDHVLGCENVFQIKELLKQLADDTGLPITLKQAGIPPEGVEVIVKEGFHPERVHNNPRKLTPHYLKEMLNSVSGF